MAESLSRLQIKALMSHNPTTDPLLFSVPSRGASCPGLPSKPLRAEELSVTVTHGLDVDTVGALGGSAGACDHGQEPGGCQGESAGPQAQAQLLLEAPGQPGLESPHLASREMTGRFRSALPPPGVRECVSTGVRISTGTARMTLQSPEPSSSG